MLDDTRTQAENQKMAPNGFFYNPIQEGEYRIRETVTETDRFGTWQATYTKLIIISTINNRLYQTERTYRNSVITFSASYPAETEYAKMRRQGVVEW